MSFSALTCLLVLSASLVLFSAKGEDCETVLDCSRTEKCEDNHCVCPDDEHGYYCRLCTQEFQKMCEDGRGWCEVSKEKEAVCVCEDDLVYNKEDKTCIDPCQRHPCMNGGSCFSDESEENGYSCLCVDSFSGPTCKISEIITTEEDSSSPPITAAQQITVTTSAPINITVETNISKYNCSQNPCINNGDCYPEGCICVTPFYGPFCEKNACEPNPCQNGGTCSGNDDFLYQCECPTNYFGDNCTDATEMNKSTTKMQSTTDSTEEILTTTRKDDANEESRSSVISRTISDNFSSPTTLSGTSTNEATFVSASSISTTTHNEQSLPSLTTASVVELRNMTLDEKTAEITQASFPASETISVVYNESEHSTLAKILTTKYTTNSEKITHTYETSPAVKETSANLSDDSPTLSSDVHPYETTVTDKITSTGTNVNHKSTAQNTPSIGADKTTWPVREPSSTIHAVSSKSTDSLILSSTIHLQINHSETVTKDDTTSEAKQNEGTDVTTLNDESTVDIVSTPKKSVIVKTSEVTVQSAETSWTMTDDSHMSTEDLTGIMDLTNSTTDDMSTLASGGPGTIKDVAMYSCIGVGCLILIMSGLGFALYSNKKKRRGLTNDRASVATSSGSRNSLNDLI